MRRVYPSGRDEGSNEWPPAAGAADTTPTPDVLDPRSRAPDAPAADRLAHGDTLARSGGRPQRVEPLGPQFGRTRLGHHVLLEKLGQGGMGVVFAAFDTRLDRKVAIKLLRAPDGERSRERMLREARAMARVSHPNVVQVYEVGEDEQLSFMVMEFVEGATLTAWLGERPRTRREVLAVFAAAGRGLAAAHREGLVHRDFKPKARFPLQTPPIPPSGRILANRGVSRRGPCLVMPPDAAGLATRWQHRPRTSAVTRTSTSITMTTTPSAPILLESFDLAAAERLLCSRALDTAGNILEAAKLLGITRHALKRRIVKHKIAWPRR
jgi:hypothetical protein